MTDIGSDTGGKHGSGNRSSRAGKRANEWNDFDIDSSTTADRAEAYCITTRDALDGCILNIVFRLRYAISCRSARLNSLVDFPRGLRAPLKVKTEKLIKHSAASLGSLTPMTMGSRPEIAVFMVFKLRVYCALAKLK